MNNIHANPVGIVKDIYKITNDVNGKIYIGQAKNTEYRFYTHCKNSSNDTLIDKAIKKYGKEHFHVEILKSQISNYNEKEKYWINKLNSKVPNGYNISDGGEEPPIFYGINHPLASIKDPLVLNEIVECLINTKKSYQEIAQLFGTNKKTVLNINNGISYYNPKLTYPIRQYKNINGTLTEKDVDEIIEELKISYDTNTNIGLRYGVSEHTIRNINSGAAHYREKENYPIRSPYASRSKVNYAELVEIIYLLQYTNQSIRSIAKQFNVDITVIQNINYGSNVYKRKNLEYPLRLPPHKKL